MLNHQQRQRVDVEVARLDVRIVRPDFVKHALPQGVTLRHRITLVGHADPRAPVRARVIEGVSNDAVHAFVGVDLLLNGHFVLGASLEAAADAHVQPFRVLAKHDEVHVGRSLPFERTQPLVQQLHRTIVDIEIQLEAGAQQNVAGVAVVRHPRIAERADQDRVELVPQHGIAIGRNRDAGGQIVIGAPRQRLQHERATKHFADRAKHLDGFGGDIDADAVARYDRYAHLVIGWFHQLL